MKTKRRKLIPETKVAEILDVSTRTLKRWRGDGINLEFHRLPNGTIKYDEADVLALVEQSRVQVVA